MKIDLTKDTKLFRTLVISGETDVIDVEKRTVTFPFSSDAVITGMYGPEKLIHSAEAMDMSRITDGAPLLEEHVPPQIGVVEKAWLETDGRGWATVRFSKVGKGAEIFDDVVDGIRRNISFGYRILDFEIVEDILVGTRWLPFEISVVAMAADTKVGVRRSEVEPPSVPSANADTEDGKVKIPAEESKTKDMNTRTLTIKDDNKMKMTAKELKEALEYTRRFKCEQVYTDALEKDLSLDEVRALVLEHKDVETASKVEPETRKLAPMIGLTEKEAQQFSLLRAIELSAFPQDPGVQKRCGFELECSRAYAEKANRGDTEGVWVPADVMLSRAFDLTTGNGAGLVATELRSNMFVDILRNKTLVAQLGAQFLENLTGPVSIPRKTASTTAYWFDPESAAITATSQPTIDQIALTPKTVGAYTDISRRLLLGSSLGVESMVRDDLAGVIGVAIDRAAYLGAAGNEPRGIFNTSGVGAGNWTTDSTPTWAEVVNAETQVDLGNALDGSFAYVMGAALKGAMKTNIKVAGTSADFIMDRDGQVNGYPAYSTNQLGTGQLVFGRFADLFIGLFSGMNIQSDPFLLATSGGLRVTALMDVDIAVRRPASFYVMSYTPTT